MDDIDERLNRYRKSINPHSNERERMALLSLIETETVNGSLFLWVIRIVNKSIFVSDSENVVTVLPEGYENQVFTALSKNPYFKKTISEWGNFWSLRICEALIQRLCMREPLSSEYFENRKKWDYGIDKTKPKK